MLHPTETTPVFREFIPMPSDKRQTLLPFLLCSVLFLLLPLLPLLLPLLLLLLLASEGSLPKLAKTKGRRCMERCLRPSKTSRIMDVAPSWGELASTLSSKQTEEERSFREMLASGKSKTNSLATLRLFDAPEGTEPTVTLYR